MGGAGLHITLIIYNRMRIEIKLSTFIRISLSIPCAENIGVAISISQAGGQGRLPQFGQAGGQAGSPVWDLYMIRIANEAFIEERIMGPFGGGRKLGRRDGLNRAGAADLIANSEGEFVPAYPAFVAVMEDSGCKCRATHYLEDGAGQIGSIGGGPDLIIYYADSRSFCH